MMGATDGYGYDDETPVHQVTLSSYRICKYEVTQKLWNLVMEDNPSTSIGDSLPVNNISWNDTQIFISKLNEISGRKFRLPTEAEWEFAARGGHYGTDLGSGNGYQYSGGYNNIEPMDSSVWHSENSDNNPHAVGTKKPNELGIYDMSGNVCEYVQDYYSRTSYTEEEQINPKGVESGDARIYRGGSFERPSWQCRLASRFGSTPTERRTECGFRLTLDAPVYVEIWFLKTDKNQMFEMSNVGMLVAVDDSITFNILDIYGNVLADSVTEVQFTLGKSELTSVEPTFAERNNFIRSIVNDKITLIGAKGIVNLYNASGIQISSIQANPNETIIDVSFLPSGIYVINCENQSFKFNKK